MRRKLNVRNLGWAFVYALVGLVVVLALLTLARVNQVTDAIRGSQTQKAPLLAQTNRAAHAAERGTRRIEACTTPGRACYDRSQRQLAQVIAGLTEGNRRSAAAAAACAATLPDPSFPTVYRCVLRQLATDARDNAH